MSTVREWRDLSEWSKQGLPLSTTSNRAAKLYDAVLTQYVGWYDDESVNGIEESLEELLKADPDFVMGHVLSNGLELIGTGTNIWKSSDLKNSMERMAELAGKSTSITDREKKHVSALKDWSEGHITKALDTWEDILTVHPTDFAALKFAHDSYFYLGYREQMRDSIARVVPAWNEKIPLYGFLHGMYAFGLVETNFYKEAEKHALQVSWNQDNNDNLFTGSKGLKLNPYDCWSTHARCHVLEMEGRFKEGISFLDQTEKEWTRGKMLACHNYWHWALYHIEKGELEAALDIFDKQVSVRSKSGAMLDLVDGSSLLYRLQLEGADVNDRWREMYQLWGTTHLDDHILVFNDVHFIMCTLGAKEETVTGKLMDSLRNFINEREGTNSEVTKEVGLKMCEAFECFDQENYAKCTELLLPLKYKIVKIGGSNAQRDVFHQLLIHSALRSPLKSHHCLARSLLAERKAMKDNSPLTERLISKTIALH